MAHENNQNYMQLTSALPRFRIVVDAMYYCGELENETYAFNDPFSSNSFHTAPGRKATLEFSEDSKRAKLIEGRNNLASYIKKVIDFVMCGNVLPKEIKIEREPFTIPMELNVNYFLDAESENTQLKVLLKEWQNVARQLAGELNEANSKIYPVSWEDVSENSPAWIAYCNLRDKKEKK